MPGLQVGEVHHHVDIFSVKPRVIYLPKGSFMSPVSRTALRVDCLWLILDGVLGSRRFACPCS